MTIGSDVLDEILSDAPLAPTTTAETDPTQPRAADGTFAPKADVATATEEQTPAVVQTPIAPSEEQPGAMVPQQALHAQRQENAELKRQLAELNGKVNLLTTQRQPPAPQVLAPQEPAKPKDFWESPDQFTDERVKTAVTPVEQMVRGMIFNTSQQNALRDPAMGMEKITAAEKWAEEAVRAGRLDPQAIAAKLSTSFDPVGDLVRMHQKEAALERVGADPDAWLEAELEKRLSDPAQQAKIIERIRGGAQAPNGQSPVTQLPPTLARLAGGGHAAEGQTDMSSEGLFRSATAGMR